MEEFEGTKGRWQMTTSALECDHNSEVATIWGDSEYGEGASLIAHIDNSPGVEKALANAKLINAAPQLLEALQKVIEIHRAGLHLSDALIKYVYPAINKALGVNGSPNLNEDTGQRSISNLTEEQIDLMRACVDSIRRHLYYDPIQGCHRVDSMSVKGMFDKEEVAALQSIIF